MELMELMEFTEWFQSTRPVRDATWLNSVEDHFEARFNPRVPCGTRRSRSGRARLVTKSFNPRVPCGTRHAQRNFSPEHQHVSIHASRAGRDFNPDSGSLSSPRFNPRVPCGTRQAEHFVGEVATQFQSTRPVRDATRTIDMSDIDGTGFNPRVPCGTRPTSFLSSDFDRCVSIHASRAGRDGAYTSRAQRTRPVSIHASRAGRDGRHQESIVRSVMFQSTRPVRDATTLSSNEFVLLKVSIHASRAGRDGFHQRDDVACNLVSIHASRAGRDGGSSSPALRRPLFQSTRPVRDATGLIIRNGHRRYSFNPRVPCGTRPHHLRNPYGVHTFQSTRPVRDATRPLLSAEQNYGRFQSTRPVRDATRC